MIEIPVFDVLLSQPTEDNPEATIEHRVRVLNGDQLRAELEAPKHGFKDLSAVPMHFTNLWLWASLIRTKTITEDFRAFKTRLLAYDKVDADPAEPSEADPTQPGAESPSPSPSPSTGPASTGASPKKRTTGS